MQKKFLITFIIAVVGMMMIPVVSHAAPAEDGRLSVNEKLLFVNSEVLFYDDESAVYDLESNTLTLNNYNGGRIYADSMGEDFKINLIGENIITYNDDESLGGIRFDDGGTISGTGSLKIISTALFNIGIVSSYNLKIENTTIEIEGLYVGISSNGNTLEIIDSKIVMTGILSYGIKIEYGDLLLKNNDINISAEDNAICVYCGKIKIDSGKYVLESLSDEGIYMSGEYSSFTMNGGKLEITGDTDVIDIQTGDIIINGGSLKGIAKNSSESEGLEIGGNVTINGGELNLDVKGTAIEASNGIVTINGGNITLNGEEGALLAANESNATSIIIKDTMFIEDEVVIKKHSQGGYYLNALGYENIEISVDDVNTLAKKAVISELDYIESAISKEIDGTIIIAKGYINDRAELKITKIEQGNESYTALSEKAGNDSIIGAYDVSIDERFYKGDIKLSFEVDSQYEGKTIIVYHKLANGEIEALEGIVKNRRVEITVSELSPFMLVLKNIVDEKDDTPKTGVNDNMYFVTIISLISSLVVLNLKKNTI